MISDTDFQRWLEDPNARRVVLLEAGYRDIDGHQNTYYAANRPYVSGPPTQVPGQGPYHTAYDDLMSSDVSFSRKLSSALYGRTRITRGNVTLRNDGRLDDFLKYRFKGQPLKLFLGSPTWERDDFRLMFNGLCDGLKASRGSMVLTLRDFAARLDQDIARPLIGSGPNSDKRSPLVFGQVFNVSPVLVDEGGHIYQVHDGQIQDITEVRDNGVPVSIRKDVLNGRFTLNQAPVGEITADVIAHGSVTAVGVAQALLSRAGIQSVSNLTALNAYAPSTVGLYLHKDQRYIKALDEVLSSIGAYWFFNRLGVFVAGRLGLPEGGATFNMLPGDIDLRGINVRSEFEPLKSVSLGYRRNYRPQSSLQSDLSADKLDVYARGHSTVTIDDSEIATLYPEAEAGTEVVTALVHESDAQTEAARRLNMVGVPRRSFEVRSRATSFRLELAQLGRVEYPGLGFEEGQLVRVVGVTDYPARGRSVLEVWR